MERLYLRETSQNVAQTIGNNMSELKTKWNCTEYSFRTNQENVQNFLEQFNANLRKDWLKAGMNGYEFINAINGAFDSNIRRFQDYIKEYVVSDSVATGEPTALITPDGSKLELWMTGKYSYSTDGYNFSIPENVSFVQPEPVAYPSPQCFNYFRYNGELYATSTYNNFDAYLLWKQNSQNPLQFDFVQELFSFGIKVGNSFLFEENGVWYLIMECHSDTPWEIYLATSSSLTGTYTLVQETPVIPFNGIEGIGNPELARVGDIIYKFNGLYYLFVHYKTTHIDRGIWRYSSSDLIHWTDEGPMLDGKIQPHWVSTNDPTRGLSNGDQSICEFKGHSYLFVTNDANQYLYKQETGEDFPIPPHIDMYIDFRPLSDLLGLKP